MSAPAIGQRWRLKSPVDVENFAVGKAGDMGTIIEIYHGEIFLKMDDDHGDVLADWMNCLAFLTAPDEERLIEDFAELVP